MALTFTGGLIGAMIIAVPFALVASLITGTVLGIWLGINTHLNSNVNTDIFIISVVLFILSMAGNINNTLSSQTNSHSWVRQIGSILIGAIITVLMLLIVSQLATFLAKQLFIELLLPRLKNAVIIFDLAYATLITLFLVVFLSSILKLHGHTWQKSLLWGFVFSLISGALFVVILHTEPQNQILIGIAIGTMIGIGASLLFALPYLFAKQKASDWAGIISGVLVSGSIYIFLYKLDYSPWTILSATLLRDDTHLLSRFIEPFIQTHSLGLIGLVGVTLLGLTWHRWQALLLYPIVSAWNLLVYRAEQRRLNRIQEKDSRQSGLKHSLFRWHSVCWDERQHLPLYGLEDYLVTVSERYPTEGQAAITYVSTTRQRWAAQAAQIELDARRLQNCDSVAAISEAQKLAAGELTGPANSLLRSLGSLSQDVAAALKQNSSYNQRLALKDVEERLERLLRELTRSSEKYAERFRPIVDHWRAIISTRILDYATEYEGEIDNPYVVALPLTAQQEIFVGRTNISKRLEQFLRKQPCPPLLLYGQRRMGKTSLLNNLTRLLPSTIIPLFVDLQGLPSLAKDDAGFFDNLSSEMQYSAQNSGYTLPTLTRDTLTPDPFSRFVQWLNEVEISLENNLLLLMLDEFEALNKTFVRGDLDGTKILGFFRHLIQHRPRLKILFSGSHTLDELEHWASYLINVQTLHISYLKENEARQLIEQPMADFGLTYTPEASQRVLELTRCHPYLVQLLCSEIVTQKNEQPVEKRWIAQVDDVIAAIENALENSHFLFLNIVTEQISATSLAVLRFIAAQGEGACVNRAQLAEHFPEQLEQSLKNLLQRELIETVEGGYRFQVELIRRWIESVISDQ
ncbi:MAG: ATP-binding protein [Candidatus Parabeggiatoa sp. nov. 2]|nr:MAG: ATP-binding protein [Gammaproteobacteria bacterium]